MSAETNKLLHLFSKLLHNPQLLMALHMERMTSRLGEKKSRTGAQGLLVELWKADGLTNAEIAEIVTSQSQLRTEIDAIVAEIEGGK